MGLTEPRARWQSVSPTGGPSRLRTAGPSSPPSKRSRLSSAPPKAWPVSPVHITPTLAVPCAPMRCSTRSLTSSELLARLAEDGYLLFRGLLPRKDVERAREVVAKDLVEKRFARRRGAGLEICDRAECAKGPNLLERQDLARHESVLPVLEHDNLYEIMEKLLVDPAASVAPASLSSDTRVHSGRNATSLVKTHPYKWLRAVSTSLHTGPHRDSTYFPSETYPTLLTAWIALGDLSPELGSLVVATGSSQLTADKEDPIVLGADGTKSGWITDEGRLRGMDWLTEAVKMGDVLVLGRERVHCSSVNVTDEWRLSVDTRWMRTNAPTPAREDLDSSEEESSDEAESEGEEASKGTESEEECDERTSVASAGLRVAIEFGA